MEGGRDLAGTILDHNVAVLTDGAGLLREGFGGTGIALRLEVVLFVRHAFSLFSLSKALPQFNPKARG